jgi:hypothetical protein
MRAMGAAAGARPADARGGSGGAAGGAAPAAAAAASVARGMLFGVQSGLRVEIFTSFEMPVGVAPGGGPLVDEKFVREQAALGELAGGVGGVCMRVCVCVVCVWGGGACMDCG